MWSGPGGRSSNALDSRCGLGASIAVRNPLLSAGWGVSSARPYLQATTPISTLGGAAGHLRALAKKPLLGKGSIFGWDRWISNE